MAIEKIWSKRAKCTIAKHVGETTVLYYKCLDTGKKKKVTYHEKLAGDFYRGRIGPLFELD